MDKDKSEFDAFSFEKLLRDAQAFAEWAEADKDRLEEYRAKALPLSAGIKFSLERGFYFQEDKDSDQ